MWNVMQCAVQGRSHIKENIPCQDKTYVFKQPDGTVIALADGAGSAKLSHIGAEGVTKYVCESLYSNFEAYFNETDGVAVKRKIVSELDMKLEELAKEYNCQEKELASTLLVVAVKEEKYILLHIGDGVIGYLKEDCLKVASHPENGEFVNTTVFTTSKEALQTMKLMKGKLGAIEGFVLMSDGPEASLYNKREQTLAPALKKVMDMTKFIYTDCVEEQLKESFEQVIKQSTTDDCSIVIMAKKEKNFPGYQMLSISDKKKLLGLEDKEVKRKRLERFDLLLAAMETPRSLAFISRLLHLKSRYAKKSLKILLEHNLIMISHGKYKTSVIMKQ